MTHVIVVNGPPRAGKDTFIEMVTAALEQKRIPVAAFSSIDPVRNMLERVGFDLSGKSQSDRRLLSLVGEAVEQHSSWRTRCCADEVSEFHVRNSGLGVIFLHIRESAVIESVRALCDLQLNRVTFTKVFLGGIRSEKFTSNKSDAAVEHMEYDKILFNNDTLDDLRVKAKLFADGLAT